MSMNLGQMGIALKIDKAADVIKELNIHLAEYQEALDKANEKFAYLTNSSDYYYDLNYGREQLKSYVAAMVYEALQGENINGDR